jgi:glyoxylase-like metal-dependent hydrolase (beta-lactamase superfamily II)
VGIPDVGRIEFPMGPRTNSVHVIRGSRGALVIDCGTAADPGEHIVGALHDLGIETGDVAWLLLTHCDVDHYGGTAAFSAAFPSARVIAHRDDASPIMEESAYLADRACEFAQSWGLDESPATLEWALAARQDCRVDLRVTGGETLDLGSREVEIMHVPGHSRGHLAVVDPAARCAVISDAVLGAFVPNADGTPAFPPTYRHVDAYLASIERLRERGLDRLMTAHYGVFEGREVEAFLNQSASFVARVDEVLSAQLAAFGPTGATLSQLIEATSGSLGSWPPEQAVTTLAPALVGHLERFIERGIVEKADVRGAICARWTGR